MHQLPRHVPHPLGPHMPLRRRNTITRLQADLDRAHRALQAEREVTAYLCETIRHQGKRIDDLRSIRNTLQAALDTARDTAE